MDFDRFLKRVFWTYLGLDITVECPPVPLMIICKAVPSSALSSASILMAPSLEAVLQYQSSGNFSQLDNQYQNTPVLAKRAFAPYS